MIAFDPPCRRLARLLHQPGFFVLSGDPMSHARDVVTAGEHVAVIGRVIEHFGDDLMVEFVTARGATRVHIGKSSIIDRVGVPQDRSPCRADA